MIGKIDPKSALDSKDLLQVSSLRTEKKTDFQPLLEEKLCLSKPLEMITIQLLSQALDALLSIDDHHERSTSSFFSSLPFGPPVKSPAIPQSPILTVSQPMSEVSNDSQEKKSPDLIVEEAARTYGVEPILIRAVIEVESDGNPLAVSPAGAQGLMQLMPSTGAELGVKNLFDPLENIMAGTRYLRQLLDRYQGNVRLALAAYNWGMGNLERQPDAMPKETQRYVLKVEDIYHSRTDAFRRASTRSPRIS